MKQDPLAHAPILPLLRALGRHGVGCEKATRARRQSERSQGRLVPGVGEPLGGRARTPCKRRKPEAMASPHPGSAGQRANPPPLAWPRAGNRR